MPDPSESPVNSDPEEEVVPSAASQLFDLRTIIAVLFAVYGIVLIVYGLVATDPAQLRKTAGININLWAGVVMTGLAVLFGLWVTLRPLVPRSR